jgi:F0F1-type ATP synthase beta subunit
VLTSRSRLIETNAVSNEHAMICKRVRQAIAALCAADRDAGADKPMLERALKLQNYFTQPFFIAEPYTKLSRRDRLRDRSAPRVPRDSRRPL